ncbi:histidine kinase [Hoeflea sp. BAL378]|nr:histidine kinase [Hoeflea sp. BAL378]
MNPLPGNGQERLDSEDRRAQAEPQGVEAFHDAAAFLAAIVESSDDAIVSKSLSGIITTWNKAAERLFGYTAEEAVGRPVTLIIPDDRLDEEPSILARIQAGDRVQHFETVRRRKDGALIDISLTISPIRARNGTIIGASKIARDISERKRAAEHQDLLLREMRHRVKNAFAITGSIISLAAHAAETPKELAADVRSKLLALSRAHDITFRGSEGDEVLQEKAVTLFDLLANILAPYEIHGERQWRLSGDNPEVGAGQLTNLALLLHEFATNAAKYGSLSVADGRLEISATAKDGVLVLEWVEANGPPLHEDHEAGFGSRLEQTVSQSLRADISRDWRPHGLAIRLIVPVEMLAEE